jgi:hypothetical protein
MPEEIIIGDEIIGIDTNPEKLVKKSFYRGGSNSIIYEGGIGKFLDLLNRNNVCIARTEHDWYFSKDSGRTWINKDEWKEESPEFFYENENNISSMKKYVEKLIQKKPELTDSNNPLLQDWLSEETYCRIELLEISNQEEYDLFNSSLLKVLSEQKLSELLYIFPKKEEQTISINAYHLHAKNELIRKRKLIDKIINESYFLSDFGIFSLYHFELSMQRIKIQFDIKTILISDVFMFFAKDKSDDFIESTIKLLCEMCYSLNIRIITVINLQRLSELQGSRLLRTFYHPYCERFKLVIEEQSNTLKVNPKYGI